MKTKVSEENTQVVKMGLEYFTTAEKHIEPVEMMGSSTLIDVKTSKKSKKEKKDGRFYKFVKKHFLQRRSSSNDVREIHIVPDDDELKWARRSGGSAASRSSDETMNSEEDRLEVVHDMAEEYIPDV